MKTSCYVPFTEYFWGVQMNMDEMEGSCSAYRRYLKCLQGFDWKFSTEETSWKTLA
jgi:hypothetical protein